MIYIDDNDCNTFTNDFNSKHIKQLNKMNELRCDILPTIRKFIYLFILFKNTIDY